MSHSISIDNKNLGITHRIEVHYLAILSFLIFFISPGIIIGSIYFYFKTVGSPQIWLLSLSISIVVFTLLYFKLKDIGRTIKLYLLGSVLVCFVGMCSHLIFPYNMVVKSAFRLVGYDDYIPLYAYSSPAEINQGILGNFNGIINFKEIGARYHMTVCLHEVKEDTYRAIVQKSTDNYYTLHILSGTIADGHYNMVSKPTEDGRYYSFVGNMNPSDGKMNGVWSANEANCQKVIGEYQGQNMKGKAELFDIGEDNIVIIRF